MASDAVTTTWRGITAQDFLTSATFAQTTGTVLGLGPGIPLTPLVSAASDGAAASAGVPVGAMYVNTGGSFAYLRTRMT